MQQVCKLCVSVLVLLAVLFYGNVTQASVEDIVGIRNTDTISLGYTYINEDYGYTIQCPRRPLGVVPADLFFEGENCDGEVLVFGNDGYKVTYGWVILRNAFTDDFLPDLNTLSDEDATKVLEKLMNEKKYAGIALTDLNEKNRGVYAMTAKELEADLNGDGIPDETVTVNPQMAITFFRASDGTPYAVELVESPELRPDTLLTYQVAVTTFQLLTDE